MLYKEGILFMFMKAQTIPIFCRRQRPLSLNWIKSSFGRFYASKDW